MFKVEEMNLAAGFWFLAVSKSQLITLITTNHNIFFILSFMHSVIHAPDSYLSGLAFPMVLQPYSKYQL